MDDVASKEWSSFERLKAGALVLDQPNGCVLVADQPIGLSRRAVMMLSLLMRRAGTIVTKDELVDHVWEGLAVSDAALTTTVRELRQALNDSAKSPHYIETVYGKGYRFKSPVMPSDIERTSPAIGRPKRGFPKGRFMWGTFLGAAVAAVIALLIGVLLPNDNSGDRGGKMAGRPTLAADADPYDKLIEARRLYIRREVPNLRRSFALVREFIADNEENAEAWSLLGSVAAVAPSWGMADRPYFAIAEEAANRAINIDPSLSMPYAIIGHLEAVKLVPDFERVLSFFDLALQRDARNTSALLWQGIVLTLLGYQDQAIKSFEQCLAADPDYLNCRSHMGRALHNLGNLERAETIWLENAQAGWAGGFDEMVDNLARQGRDEAVLIQLRDYFRSRPNVGNWVIEPTFRAWTDEPGFDKHAEFDRVMNRLNEEGFRLADDPNVVWRLWIAFDRYDQIRPLGHMLSSWGAAAALPDFAASPHRKRYLKSLGAHAYWEKHGYPAGCTRLSAEDFDCL